MREIRVRAKNAAALAAALRAAGHEAEALPPGSADSGWYGGCSDPGCCDQHPGVVAHPERWCAIRTTASGRRAHQIWLAAGLVSPAGWEEEP